MDQSQLVTWMTLEGVFLTTDLDLIKSKKILELHIVIVVMKKLILFFI
jgi:hypothetical protein